MDWKALAAGIALLSAVEAGATGAAQPQTWERRGPGSWGLVPASQPAATTTPATQPEAAATNDLLDRADRMLARRQGRRVRGTLLSWLRANRDAPDRDRGLYLLAEAYRQSRDGLRAFYHLDELLDYYPERGVYDPALEKQFAIANTYLAGRKDRLFGLPLLGRRDEAVEMLFRIQERSPGSPLAERALLRSADYYYDAAQYDLAGDAYAAYLRSYARSPAAPRVRLRQAFSSLAQFRGLDFDATPLVDARAQLEDVATEYPDLAAEENVREVIERIDAALAAKLYRTADYYRRTAQPQAAAHMYRSIVAQYPNSRDAARAEQALARLPATARNAPPPAAAGAVVEPERISVPGPDVQ